MLLMELRWAGKARETLFMISDSLAFLQLCIVMQYGFCIFQIFLHFEILRVLHFFEIL